MGFPPGIAESMVYQYFRKYQVHHEKRFPPNPEIKAKWDTHQKQEKAKAEEAKKEPPKIEEIKEEVKKEEKPKEVPKQEKKE